MLASLPASLESLWLVVDLSDLLEVQGPTSDAHEWQQPNMLRHQSCHSRRQRYEHRR